MGDALMLRRVISNLVSNAVRHAYPETVIRVAVSTQEHEACLTVQNAGDTIPEHHLAHLFERFYRADGARQRTEEGVGLGLAITRSIVFTHQGKIKVSSQHGMTQFTITLPLA